ncbi:MAG: SsrA-binding protein SmpB [Pseudodesulfovibrio sp.]|uniref:SsrA-binding protein n=1 Tax=Pseudodesulfovibrio aespoeensis (strain ATCC 700646 / DSM 10631 / Aspo-2) TaxID=643562 RepID=E6VQR5_PSEA9|nr:MULTISPECIES: SsrA-binding protein SmpB [Pseudodesulfovibrio]MBU4193331.1 SsrA-binding protein SmpB [Pseudomonadota bacterium]ADU61792.1 SsrA-binding protein [Pseudodesulfovibrio aespoeensis Aspo-2]MBU4243065.1 SsrA-binding protein SmpB [Pseudomonadota bacterium]MBU4379489.1 SsrA-binding protein SmpB [Pseudomonadota bacterium]MBU4476676.1 SsrA-binding protein SmpB [Pseudomonadota bacterium]
MAKKKSTTTPDTIGTNKQARRLYDILETFEAGISLLGSEVKSLRGGHVAFKDGYVQFRDHSAFLVGVHIAPYEKTGEYDQHDPERPRQLLLHKREILVLKAKSDQKGLTVIPMKMYFSRGKIKVLIGLGKGKNVHSRKQDLKDRDIARDTARQLADHR